MLGMMFDPFCLYVVHFPSTTHNSYLLFDFITLSHSTFVRGPYFASEACYVSSCFRAPFSIYRRKHTFIYVWISILQFTLLFCKFCKVLDKIQMDNCFSFSQTLSHGFLIAVKQERLLEF